MRIYHFIFFAIVLVSACKDSVLKPKQNEADYHLFYPVEIGNSLIYEVDYLEIDSRSNYYDTANYFIKEVIAEYFIDNAGDSAIKIERYYRENESENWMELDVWHINPYPDELHVVEENNRYVKLKNPIEVDAQWNGNKYNRLDTLNEYQYIITSIGADDVNGFIFDSVLTVQQRYDSSLIEKILDIEKYAKNIGLIYKEQTNINSQEPDINVPIENRITTATILKMSLINYQHED